MLNVLHKKNWFEKIDQLTTEERNTFTVDCYPKPHGIFFNVREEDGVSILEHNGRIHAGDPISTTLVKAGYTGRIIIGANMGNHQLPRWLSYQLINYKKMSPIELQRWLSNITVYTFKPIQGSVNIAIQTIYPMTLPINSVITTNRTRSQSDDYDGMCFNYEDDFYHILPSRICNGEVRSVDGSTLVVLVDLPEGPRPIRARYYGSDEAPSALIGSMVKVKYTERLKGRCINNLMSATVIAAHEAMA